MTGHEGNGTKLIIFDDLDFARRGRRKEREKVRAKEKRCYLPEPYITSIRTRAIFLSLPLLIPFFQATFWLLHNMFLRERENRTFVSE